MLKTLESAILAKLPNERDYRITNYEQSNFILSACRQAIKSVCGKASIDEKKLSDFLTDNCTLSWDANRGCAVLLMNKNKSIGCLNDLVKVIAKEIDVKIKDK